MNGILFQTMKSANGTIATSVLALLIQCMASLPAAALACKPKIKLIKPWSLNKTENTIPIAMALVTYGKKNTVCKVFWKALIEFKRTEISKANAMETGTVIKVRIKVFLNAVERKNSS